MGFDAQRNFCDKQNVIFYGTPGITSRGKHPNIYRDFHCGFYSCIEIQNLLRCFKFVHIQELIINLLRIICKS